MASLLMSSGIFLIYFDFSDGKILHSEFGIIFFMELVITLIWYRCNFVSRFAKYSSKLYRSASVKRLGNPILHNADAVLVNFRRCCVTAHKDSNEKDEENDALEPDPKGLAVGINIIVSSIHFTTVVHTISIITY